MSSTSGGTGPEPDDAAAGDGSQDSIRTRRQRLASWMRRGWPAVLLALAVAAVVAFVVIEGGDAAKDDSRVVASYGDHELTLADLAVLIGGSPDAAPPADEASAATLTTWLFSHAAAEELAARGAEISDAHRADAAISAQTQGFADGSVEHDYWATAQAVILALSDYAADSAESQGSAETFDPEYLCASHVLAETEAQARDAKQRADAGEDFGDLATELSIEPAADPDGANSRGDLGCGPADRYVEDFVAGARTAQGPGIVGPIRTDFGWHVIEVRSMGPLASGNHGELSDDEVAVILEQAQQAVQIEIAEEIFGDVLHEAIHRISDAAFVDSRFGTWDDNLGAVVAAS